MSSAPGVMASDWVAAYPPPRSLPLDQEALRIYERAYYIGIQTEGPDDPPVTFTTVAAALLVGDDETSHWFALQAGELGPARDAVFSEKQITSVILDSAARQSGEPPQLRLSADKHLLTASSRAVLENAESWAQRVGGSDIGVRHLVASYVLNPPLAHRAQMQRWQVNENGWRSAFFEWVAQRFTWEQWTDASQRPSPTRGLPTFDQQEVKIKGAELAWPGDASAMKILERAAHDHARRQDPWLPLRTVFFAIVETMRHDDTVRADVLPLWEAIQGVSESYQRASEAYYPPNSLKAAGPLFSQLDISPRVLNVLETARELAAATLVRRSAPGAAVTVGALHLTGALLSRRVDGDDELTVLGINPQELRLKLIIHAQTHAESSDVWREMLGEEETLLAGRPVDLNSDEPEAVVRLDESWKSDPLAIRPDVEAFAALLASRNLEPPLSIGLFGPWGSGKTTFLKRLRRAVQHRADEARHLGSAQSTFVPNVVHVEFNAWHYTEDALISSLIDAIFRQITAYIKDEQVVAGKKWGDQKREALESTKRRVEAAKAQQNAAAGAVAATEQQLAKRREEAAAGTTRLQSAVDVVWTTTKSELQKSRVVKDSGVIEAVGDTVKDVNDLRARLDMVRARPARIIGDLGWSRSVLFGTLVLVLPPLVGWVVGEVLKTSQVGQLLSSVTALLSVVGLWARAATGAVAKVDQAIVQVVTAYERRIAADPRVREAQSALDAARAGAATAAASLQTARNELARAQAEAAAATLPAQTLQLVSGRIEDMSYKKELTTLSLARADLDALSRILRDQRSDPGSSTPTLRAVDRVILYIDDLDRCKPEDVVRVLQLVHMLLAFELFVVVVAVDARWVEQALRQSYPWLAGGGEGTKVEPGDTGHDADPLDGRVTPQDYLEKIFQIAFWLEPMTAGRAASYLASLVRSSLPAATAEPASGASPPVPPGGKIEISALELDYMRMLAAYVGPSPRRVKRLVNAYRLIKARLSDAQLTTFLTDRASESGGRRSGPYQIVIVLLVIGTGVQSASTQIMKELAEWDPTQTYDSVVVAFRGRNDSDWTMAAQAIETLMRTQKAKDVSELRGWARKVGRFLLHGPSANLRPGGALPQTAPRIASKSEPVAGSSIPVDELHRKTDSATASAAGV